MEMHVSLKTMGNIHTSQHSKLDKVLVHHTLKSHKVTEVTFKKLKLA